jgi:tRNA(Ile)-lysidine synthase
VSTTLAERVADRLSSLVEGEGPLLVAVSGGPDSLAMLDLLVEGRARHRLALEVVHIDHGISPTSGTIAERVARESAAQGLPFHLRTLALGADASETRARRARRQALRLVLAEVGAAGIALAHHADDQIETVLLRVLRGSGPAGLAGMAPRRGPWLRPLLEVPRQALEAHLTARGLSAWQDPANSDPRHLRSWLRTVALPVLEARVPDLRRRVGDLAGQAGENRRAWNQVPSLLVGLDLRAGDGVISVAAPPLRGYRSEVRRAVISALARRFGVPVGARKLARVERIIVAGRSGRVVRLGTALEAELTFDRLLLRRPEPPPFAAVVLPAEGAVGVGPHRFRVGLEAAPARQLRDGTSAALMPGRYLARPWRPGDRIRPLGGTGSRSVVVLLREARVAAGRRPGWPVVVPEGDDATIVWVPGICRSGDRVPHPGEEALRVECDLG